VPFKFAVIVFRPGPCLFRSCARPSLSLTSPGGVRSELRLRWLHFGRRLALRLGRFALFLLYFAIVLAHDLLLAHDRFLPAQSERLGTRNGADQRHESFLQIGFPDCQPARVDAIHFWMLSIAEPRFNHFAQVLPDFSS
jgi:hypothetical protein